MIITDKFVMLNFPKTGSSFVRAALKEIHGYNRLSARLLRMLDLPGSSSMTELLLPTIDKASIRGLPGQHGTYRQIPEKHRHKGIVSVIRNPFDRYVSDYLFGWWKRYPPANTTLLAEAFPHFPDLSFAEYCHMNDHFGRQDRLGDISPRIELGLFTIQFIQFYFKEPDSVLRRIDDGYISHRRYLADIAPITFLHQENLRAELYEFLLSLGYSEEKIRFILEAEGVNVTDRENDQRQLENFYTRQLVEEILQKDRLLFELFPEYGTDIPCRQQQAMGSR